MNKHWDEDGNGFVLLIGIIVGGFVAAFAATAITESAWQQEAISHGAATYVEENGKTVFKWKDQVKE